MCTVEARATERSGGNVSYAQHVIFGDPSEHFFARGTFAHPLHVSVRARPGRPRTKETKGNGSKGVVNRSVVLVAHVPPSALRHGGQGRGSVRATVSARRRSSVARSPVSRTHAEHQIVGQQSSASRAKHTHPTVSLAGNIVFARAVWPRRYEDLKTRRPVVLTCKRLVSRATLRVFPWATRYNDPSPPTSPPPRPSTPRSRVDHCRGATWFIQMRATRCVLLKYVVHGVRYATWFLGRPPTPPPPPPPPATPLSSRALCNDSYCRAPRSPSGPLSTLVRLFADREGKQPLCVTCYCRTQIDFIHRPASRTQPLFVHVSDVCARDSHTSEVSVYKRRYLRAILPRDPGKPEWDRQARLSISKREVGDFHGASGYWAGSVSR